MWMRQGYNQVPKQDDSSGSRLFGLGWKEGTTLNAEKEKQIFKFLLILQEALLESTTGLELVIKWRIYFHQFFAVWVAIERSSENEFKNRCIQEFVSLIFNFVERYVEVVEKDNLKNLDTYEFIMEYIQGMINVVTIYLIKPVSSSQKVESELIAMKSLKIMNPLMKLFKKLDASTQGRLSQTLKMNNEGLDSSQPTSFETCHPLNRG